MEHYQYVLEKTISISRSIFTKKILLVLLKQIFFSQPEAKIIPIEAEAYKNKTVIIEALLNNITKN